LKIAGLGLATFIYRQGDGRDIIRNFGHTPAIGDILEFSYITPDQFVATRMDNDLILAITGGGELRIENHFLTAQPNLAEVRLPVVPSGARPRSKTWFQSAAACPAPSTAWRETTPSMAMEERICYTPTSVMIVRVGASETISLKTATPS
jgi:hypothetical protein